MKNFLLILFSLVCYNLFSQVNAVPTCHTSQDPNLETGMQSLNALYECQLAYDTAAHLLYKFVETNPAGNRWVLVGEASDAWLVGGNSNGLDEVFGTNDNFDVILETNNIPFGRFYAQDQSVAFGSYTGASSPFSNMYVVGTPSHITGSFNMNGNVGAGGLGFYLNSNNDRYIQALPNSERMIFGMLTNGTNRVDVMVAGSLEDRDGDKGTAGQILSSGVDDTDWADITLGKKITELSDSTWLICDSLYVAGIFVSEKCDTLETCCGKQGNFRVFNYYTNPAGDAVVYMEHINSDGTIQLDSIVFPSTFTPTCTDNDYIYVNDNDNSGFHACDPDFRFGHAGSRTFIAGGDGSGTFGGIHSTDLFSAFFGNSHTAGDNFSIFAGLGHNTTGQHYNAVFGRTNTSHRYDLIGGWNNISNNGYSLIGGTNNSSLGQYGNLLAGADNTISGARFAATFGDNNSITNSWRSWSVGGSNVINTTSPTNYQIGTTNNISAGSYSFQFGRGNDSNGGFAYQFGDGNDAIAGGTSRFQFGLNNIDNRAGTGATSFSLGRTNTIGLLAADALIVGEGNYNGGDGNSPIILGSGNNINTGDVVTRGKASFIIGTTNEIDDADYSGIIGRSNILSNGQAGQFIIGQGIVPTAALSDGDQTFVNNLRIWEQPETLLFSDSVLVRDSGEEGEIKNIGKSDWMAYEKEPFTAIAGSNVFAISNTPVSNSVKVIVNQFELMESHGQFSVSGTNVTVGGLSNGDLVEIQYNH